jgi:hypothetical protein
MSEHEPWNIAAEMAKIANRDVDVIDLRNATTVLQFQVINEGKRLWVGNAVLADQFETFVCSSYQRLNEERKDQIADIKKRGSVFDG